MESTHLFAIGILLAWLAGIRVYLTVFGVGLAGLFGWMDLPPALEATTSPWVLGVSGVLAVVTCGLFLSWHSSRIFTQQTRLQAYGTWGTAIFILNGVIFIRIFDFTKKKV